MSARNPEVDSFISQARLWPEELKQLRRILLACGLSENMKWHSPCYSHKGKNIAIIGELKASCVLSFFKGALLNDPAGLLQKPGENTRSGRIIPFTNPQDIVNQEALIKSYVYEAIEIEKAGMKVDFSENREPEMPQELLIKFDEIPELKVAFEALTPGRRRGYLLHFSGAKQASTRKARINKHIGKILAGKGLNDW